LNFEGTTDPAAISARTRSRRWPAVVLILGILTLSLLVAFRLLPGYLRPQVVAAIEQHFDGTAELQDLDISVFPDIHVVGTNLTLWYQGRKDQPPMISIKELSLHAGLLELFDNLKHVSRVRLEGLIIQIPATQKSSGASEQEDRAQREITVTEETKRAKFKAPAFAISDVIADGAIIRILPSKPGAEPLEFDCHHLRLQSVGPGLPMDYQAELDNAKPPGLIHSNGKFGPWHTEEPGATPVEGDYTFQNANLSVFKGISGTLSSQGKFNGVLEKIAVEGTTDTPDFAVRTGNHKVHLVTNFKAIVDGTDGDTYLLPINATIGRSPLTAKGKIEHKKGINGKFVILDVSMEKGRLEDLMILAVPGSPPMTGKIRMKTNFELPPGDQDVIEKLKLSGTFGFGAAEFKNPVIQQKVETLSRRSRGITDDDEKPDERIVSDLKGIFALNHGVASFQDLSFIVPGAQVQLAGKYGLKDQSLDFAGELRMQAKLSQTQTGIKSLLLKVVDPFFHKKGAGAVVPIKITGTRTNPQFGLNLHKK